jgi:hypothetical protein
VTVDEKTLRAHFERAARANVPPSTVDVARARKFGRRRLLIRWAGVPAASFGAVVAVGALFAAGVLPTGATSRPAVAGHGHKAHVRKHEHASGPMAPVSFDPLAIYATFGWLPRGFSVVNPDNPQIATQSFAQAEAGIEPGSYSRAISLTVLAAHMCTLTGAFVSPPESTPPGVPHRRHWPAKRYSAGLLCQWNSAPQLTLPIVPAGHLANGDPAYWVLPLPSGPINEIAWQYARDGWAVAQWYGPDPQIVKVAAHVRFRSNLRLRFPYRLTGIPASWKVSAAGSQVEGGRLVGYDLYLRPSHGQHGSISILVEPPSLAGGCSNIGGTTQSVTFDGAAGVTRTHGQEACIGNLHGMFVYVSSDQAGGALGLLRHLHVLGPDPANWTTHPLG